MAKGSAASRPVFTNHSNDIALTIEQMVELLSDLTRGWPKVIAGELSVMRRDGLLQPLRTEHDLFAWLDRYAHVVWTSRGVSRRVFFAGVGTHVKRYEWATALPHYPRLPGVCYLRRPPEPRATGALDELVDLFCPATPHDREMIKAMHLTPATGIGPGQRPAFVLSCEPEADGGADSQGGRGVGKTTLVECVARLYGGAVPVLSTGDPERMHSDLLSPGAAAYRIVVLDNLKSYRFSNAVFERFVTAPVIGGHRLYQGHAERPNHLTFLITVNGPSFSKDMAQRSVLVRLKRPRYAPGWAKKTTDFIDKRRDDILADIGHILTRPPRPLTRVTRFGAWDAAVLARLNDPDALIREMQARQGEIDGDDLAADDVIDHFEGRLRRLYGERVDRVRVFVPSPVASQWVRELTGDRTLAQAAAYLRHLGHPRLKSHRFAGARGYLWSGRAAAADAPIERRDDWERA